MQFNEQPIDADQLADILIADSLKRNILVFGIEGLEEKINELYCTVPDMRDRILHVYNKMYKGKI